MPLVEWPGVVVGRHFLGVEQLLLRLLLLTALAPSFLGGPGIALIVAGAEKGHFVSPHFAYHQRRAA